MNYQDMLNLVNEKLNIYESLMVSDQNLINQLLEYKEKINDIRTFMYKKLEEHSENDLDIIKDCVNRVKDNANILSSIENESKEVMERLRDFSGNIVTSLKEYANAMALQQKLTSEIKVAEQLSKKKDVGNLIETVNAEGRKKMISEYLIDDYNSLVEQKKESSKMMIKSWAKLQGMNLDSLGIKKEKIVEERYEESFAEKSIEEKLNELQRQIQEIINMGYLPNTGKKCIVTYNNLKYKIPLAKKGQFGHLNIMLSSLRKKQVNIIDHFQGNDISTIELTQTSSELVVDNKVGTDSILISYQEIKHQIEDILDESLALNGEVRTIVEYDGKTYKIPVAQKNKFEELKRMLVKEESTISITDKEIEQHKKSDNKVQIADPIILPDGSVAEFYLNNNDFINQSIVDDKNTVLEVVATRKPKNKNKLKNKIVAVAATIAAAAVLFVSCKLSQKDMFKDNIIENNYNDMSISMTQEIHKESSIFSEDEINKTVENLNIGDNVSIRDGASIYDTGAYASKNDSTKAENPYFGYDIDRQVSGVVVTMSDGSTKVFKDTNGNEYNEAIESGGKVSAYLTNGTEGFFNSEDVSLGGRNR